MNLDGRKGIQSNGLETVTFVPSGANLTSNDES